MAVNDELDRYLNSAVQFVHQIRERYPSIWNVVGEAMAKSNEVIHLVAENRTSRSQQDLSVFLGLWGSVRRYQINSILEIFSRNLDEGLAILRMATELARTLKAISTDTTLYATWVKGRERRSAEFAAAAYLDRDDPIEKAVLAAYNFCSSYGTHGHKNSAAFLVDTFMGKEASIRGVAAIAQTWFLYCVPLHRICLKSSIEDSSDLFFACNLDLTVVETSLIERIHNDPFFKAAI